MRTRDPIAGSIGQIVERSPQEQALHDKMELYGKKALIGDDAVYDREAGRFLIHGKHGTLAGVETVISIDAANMMMTMAVTLQSVFVPMLLTELAMRQRAKGKPA